MRGSSAFMFLFLCASVILAQPPDRPAKQTGFKVKYVEAGTVYLDAGRAAGLTEGMKLVIRRERTFGAASGDGHFKASIIVAKLRVVSVSNRSAMCQVQTKNAVIRSGDIATPVKRSVWRAASPSTAPGAQELDQEMRTSVLAPAMANIGNEAKTPPPTASTNTPISLADVARANRRRREQERAAANATAARPRITVASVPLSVAEEKRARQNRARPAQAASGQGPGSTATSGTLHSSRAANQPVVVATNNTEVPAATTKQQKVDAKKTLSAKDRGKPGADPMTASASTPKPQSPKPPAPASNNPAARTTKAALAPSPPPPARARVAQQQSEIKTVVPPPAQNPAVTTASMEPAAEAPIPGKTEFNVKYVAEDAVYIDAGKNAGLSEGMKLSVKNSSGVIAELAVISVSNTSAVCEIHNKTADIQRGNVALLSQSAQDKMAQAQAMGPTRKYPQVISFSQGDPLDEEVRASIPKPPLPEINRARGRIGVDYTFINNRGAGATTSSQIGGVVRADITRIGGTYWNLNGYWRGRLNSFSSSAQPQSVFDLINRTYTIGFTYVNPGSHWTAGVGRLYLPWAPSLDTLDGGYLGLRFGPYTTIGVFAGTTPDPTSFDYNPDRRTAGAFVAIEAGSFDHLRFTSAEGVAVTALEWREDRQFVFGENGLFYKRLLSIYNSAQADIQRLPTGGTTQGLSRSFTTFRLQPFSWFSIDVNHNYFRDVPTFDPSLVGTGLLDKFLFQGLSAGSRLELPGRISLYDNFGQSNRSGDPRKSINQLYGLTMGRLWITGLRLDVRYSKFDSTFGAGNYRAASLSRSFKDVLRLEANAGQQNFVSSLGTPTNYRLLGATVDLNLGGHYFIESSMNLQRGSQQDFQQWLITTGYRFDSRKRQ